ncbi:MAG TPA: hypothetical protein VFG86_20535 [Chloroflexota bacterium]|nr:hypothetical protein [Chloroflexota bacterium]
MAERPAPSEKPILQKLLLKSGHRAAVLNAPPSYQSTLQQIPNVHQELDGAFDFIHVFATRREELLRDGPKWRAALAPNGLLWLSYPKGKAVKTDLNRDVVRVSLHEVGLETVSQVSIDDVWSALRAKAV